MSTSTPSPKSSTPKANKSTVFVSHVTPSPTLITNGSQNGCLSNSASYEEDSGRRVVDGSSNGNKTNRIATASGNSLESSCSSQDTQDGETQRKKERKEKLSPLLGGGRGGTVDSDGGVAAAMPVKEAEGRGGNIESGLPKIKTTSASPKMTSSASNQPHHLVGHTRASSTSSVGSPSSAEQASSSSSSLVSHDSSFASREALIEQLKSELHLQGADSRIHGNGGGVGSQKNSEEVMTQLLEHIVTLKMDLETLKEENKRLKSTRSEMDDELHTLTENLFEEAYKMVDEAKGNKVVAEKRLADAAGKIDAMETEMFALKNLLQNPEGVDSSFSDVSVDKLHPSPQHKHHHHKRHSVKKAIKKLSKKISSSRVGGGSPTPSKVPAKPLPPPGIVIPIAVVEHKGGVVRGGMLREGELLPSDFAEFSDWLGALSCQPDHTYLERIIRIDLVPCLTFKNEQLSAQVLEAVKDNHLLVESITNSENGRCALSGDEVVCTHRLKLGDKDEWLHISQPCRDRIVAACDFYMCIGHIQKGIIKSDPTVLYWRVSRLRAIMSLSRLNLHLPDEN